MPESEKKRMGERRQAAEAYLREVTARHDLSPAEVETIALDGSPVDRIQEFARLYNIDLLAMSTHGHTGLWPAGQNAWPGAWSGRRPDSAMGQNTKIQYYMLQIAAHKIGSRAIAYSMNGTRMTRIQERIYKAS